MIRLRFWFGRLLKVSLGMQSPVFFQRGDFTIPCILNEYHFFDKPYFTLNLLVF
jgi:hypothetical protein